MEKKGMNKMHRKYDESLNAEFLKKVNTFRSVAEVSRSMCVGDMKFCRKKS